MIKRKKYTKIKKIFRYLTYTIVIISFCLNLKANEEMHIQLIKETEKTVIQKQEIQNLLNTIEKQNQYYISEISLPKEIQEFVYDECLKYDNVTYEEALAVMMTENAKFDAKAVNYNTNGTYDTGLFQINSVNAQWLNEKLGITDLTNPYQNIQAGIYILNSLEYEAHQKYMSYNMGVTGAKRKINKGIESTAYSNKVINTIQEIKKIYTSSNNI